MDLIEADVLPSLLKNPQHERLDGGVTQGAKLIDAWGRFRFGGDIWEVTPDNRYEPLMLAYWSAKHRGEDQTFERAEMKKRQKLVLAPDLRALRSTKDEYLYLYQARAAA